MRKRSGAFNFTDPYPSPHWWFRAVLRWVWFWWVWFWWSELWTVRQTT